MSDLTAKAAVQFGDELLPVTGSSGPIIVFELAPSFGHVVGLIDICLATTRTSVGADGKVIRGAEIVANLRCTQAGAIALRDALNGCLLMLAPVEQPDSGRAN